MDTMLFDHRTTDINRWFEAYSGGTPVRKTEIFDALSQSLQPQLKDYRYLRTAGCFIFEDDLAIHYITMERGKGVVRFRFGITHKGVEDVRARLYGQPKIVLKHTPITISMYSANIGPLSRGWHLPYRVEWPIFGSDGIALARPEVISFVEEAVLPYLSRHRDAEAIRETFLNSPRRADTWLPSEQVVFAINHLLARTDRNESDYRTLRQARISPDDLTRLEDAFAIAQARNAA